MPGLEGPELCRRIRALEDRYCYVIMLSALTNREHVLAGMGAGADDYLGKPLDRGQLELRLVAAARVADLHRRLEAQRRELEQLNAKLYADARRDPLLGIGNRRRLIEDLHGLVGRIERYGHAAAIAVCDVDNFKAYNDTFGHPAGDRVLRSVADALVASSRTTDAVYRYGGEEIVVLLPEQDVDGGATAAERFRHAVEALALPHPGNPAGVVTISIGVGAVDADVGGSLEAADAALYRAKAAGRNRVVRAIAPGRPASAGEPTPDAPVNRL